MDTKESTRVSNHEIHQYRADEMFDTYKKYGYTMFPQQKSIYKTIAESVVFKSVLDVGCGDGTGAAILERRSKRVIATDLLLDNITFARCLYPWLEVRLWDCTQQGCLSLKSDVVTCIEVIEHIENVHAAIKNVLACARHCAYISSPNGRGREKPPRNPFHVREYTPEEMIAMIKRASPDEISIEVLGWEDFKQQEMDTPVDTLVYKVAKV